MSKTLKKVDIVSGIMAGLFTGATVISLMGNVGPWALGAGALVFFATFSSCIELSWRHNDNRRRRKAASDATEEKNNRDLVASCHSIMHQLQTDMRRVPEAESAKVKECVTLCANILHAITTDTNKKRATTVFMNDYLRPTEETITVYLRLKARKLSIAEEALKNADEKILPELARKLELFYNNIHLGDITRLATAEAVHEVKARLSAQAQVELGLDA